MVKLQPNSGVDWKFLESRTELKLTVERGVGLKSILILELTSKDGATFK